MLKLKENTNHRYCQQNMNLPQSFTQFYSLFFNHSLKVILRLNMSQIHNSSYNKNFTQKFQTLTMNQILMPANDYSFKKKKFFKISKFICSHKMPFLSYFGHNEKLLLKSNILSFVKVLIANIMNPSSKIQL